MATYRLTAARRAALRKAQLASARKRRGRRISRKAKAGGAAVGVIGAVVARHRISGSSIRITKRTNPVSAVSGKVIKPHGWTAGRAFGRTEYNPNTQYKTRRGVIKGRDFRAFTVASPKRGPLGNNFAMTYQHNNLFGRRVNFGVRTPVDRDAIPLYNRKAQKPWPHIGPDLAREQNARGRSTGMTKRKRKRGKKR